MTVHTNIAPVSGEVIEVALNRLKKSPRNARITPHKSADVETLAASIAAKGLLQPLVVEPQLGEDGAATGSYFVTIGEGRRLAHKLLAKRKAIKASHPVRCIVDVVNDAHEISLDENVTRFAMHPADQFEAFQQVARDKGWSAEEIAARFGVTAVLVRQRLRLASVSPKLMDLYREDEMSLEQLMAFTLTDDHARQEEVWSRLSWNSEPYYIKRLLTEGRVASRDKRAVFIGAEAYEAAGGVIERDLFSEGSEGWFADPALLDQLAQAKLEEAAVAVWAEGWKWANACIDYPSAHGLRRLYPKERPWSAEEAQAYSDACDAYNALAAEWEQADDVPAEVEADLSVRQDAVEAMDRARYGYEPEDVSRSGVFVVLGHDGTIRYERGFVLPEDEPPTDPTGGESSEGEPQDAPEAKQPGKPALSERLVADLTAHRTAALRHALGEEPEVALLALTHAVVLASFYFGHDLGSCLEVRIGSEALGAHAPGLAESIAGQALEARHAAFAARLPDDPREVWQALDGWSREDRLAILAHGAALSLNAVQTSIRRSRAHDHADALGTRLGLDMTSYWRPTVDSYLGRITKALVLDAVREARSPADASRIEMLKKPDMAAQAEALLAGTGWLPPPLRGPSDLGAEA